MGRRRAGAGGRDGGAGVRGAVAGARLSGLRPLTRHEVKLAALSAAPALLVAVACLGAFYWYRRRQDPIALGKALNQSAWESSFEERGLPVPPSGPRDGYWGSRLGPKVSDPSVGWHEGRILVPGLLDIDARGFQHYVSAAERKSRVVIFGGSVALGGYASAISATYFHVLGMEIERLSTPADITIVVGGAWKAIQEADALYAYGKQLAPDLIVFLDGLNDLTNGATSRTLFGQRTATSDGSDWTPQYHAHDYEQRVADYLTIIGRAAELSARRGGKMLVVLQPSLAERSRPAHVLPLPPPRARERPPVGAALHRLAHGGVTEQHVDRQPVGHVLVGRLLPGEVLPVLGDEVLQERHGRQVGKEGGPVGHVDLEAEAEPLGPLVERRLEGVVAQHEPRQPATLEAPAHRPEVEPRRAEDLERTRRPAPLRHVRPFQQHLAGIDDRGVEGRHVRRGKDPGKTGVGEEHAPPPSLHRHHGERAASGAAHPDAVGAPDGAAAAVGHAQVDERGQLAERQPVAHGDGIETHERGVSGPDQVPLERLAAERIRPIEDDDLLAGGGAGLERERRRPLEGVDARPDVLELDEQQVDALQHLRRGRAGLRVEAVDRNAELGIDAVSRLDHVVLLLAGEAVLRPEEGAQALAAETADDVACRDQLGRDGRGVQEQPDPPAAQPPRPLARQHLEAGEHARGPSAAGLPSCGRHGSGFSSPRREGVGDHERPTRLERDVPARTAAS